VRIVLTRGATLSGRVIDAGTRAPIAEAQVELDAATSSGANAIARAVTDAGGGYALEGVPPRGPFSVRVRHPSYVTKIVPGLDARGAPSTRSDIELKPLGDGGASEELVGIGATLLPSPAGGVTIAGLIEGGPAERAGLEKGDRIVRVDGADATSMTMADCVQRLRGAAGTRVSVGVDRDGQRIEVTIAREVVVR
jgi:membrane-associated protease RseP (regulator of RpoE activity)